MNSDNPYSSPSSPVGVSADSPKRQESLGSIARTTFLAWEKLRLVYIAILIAVTLVPCLLEPRALGSLGFWSTVFFGAIFANVCYLAGPILDTYVTWLGWHTKWLRFSLFVVGTLFACLMTVVTVFLLVAKIEATGVSIS